ncbi:MAG: 3-oxoacyl-ACP reductase FabG [Coriobacteriales bacterium]|jgi:3-oxoacyl-[acyl-carrier protein] reductase|nr:3-oxoacyl-ACP reductase FabG [Coriobacteriales bacterium]
MAEIEKVALVTGASKGIGAAIALELGKTFTVIVNYCSNEEKALEVASQIIANGGKAKTMRADVTNEDDVVAMFRNIKNTYKTLDLLVNNAGVTSDGFLMTMSLESWNKVIQTDLTSVFLCTREAIKVMYNSKTKGRIINISSVSGVIGLEGQANYSAAKGGVISFSKSVAKEVSKYGITVNVIAPGFIETEMIKKVPKPHIDQIVSGIPIKRVGTVEEIAKLAAYLSGEDAGYFTGKVFTIDGGMVI